MPKQNTVLQVFIASPSDVQEERNLIGSVIDEQNRNFSRTFDITFELIQWEHDVRPGFASEPQEVINRQVPENYDVFIGIFWSRVGTPTKSSISGSLEEFERALQRYKETGAPEIMIYFKETPLPPSKIEIDQLRKLHDFKESLSSHGGLYSTFEDTAGFESSLRTHLAAIAHNARTAASSKLGLTPNRTDHDVSEERDEELGYFDYIELHSQSMNEMSECLGLITKLMSSQTERIAKRTAETKESPSELGRTKAFMSLQASDMVSFADQLRPIVARHAAHRSVAFDALGNAISLHREIGGSSNQLVEMKNNLSTLLANMSEAREAIERIRELTINIPRLTKDLNVGKRAQADALNGLIEEISSTHSTAKNVLDSIARLA